MKYNDEVVQVNTVQLAKRKVYGQDIDQLIKNYEGLLARNERDAKAVRELGAELRAMTRARDGFRRQAEARALENQRLKGTLTALRRSRAMRLGRLVLSPLRITLAAGRASAAFLRRLWAVFEARLPAVPVSDSPASVTSAPVVAKHPGTVTKPAAAPAATYEELQREFAGTPSKGAAMKLLSHSYFVRGELTAPADFIERHHDLLTSVTDSERRLIQNILGQRSLLVSGVFLSPRQPNAGYLAERGRIMYCAHSTGHFNSNGYSTRTAGITAGLMAQGADVRVVARPGYPWDIKTDVKAPGNSRFEELIGGVPHIFNPGPSWTTGRLDHYLTESVDVFVREAQRNRVSLVHAASNYVTALPALTAARRLGIPFVYEVRGLWEVTELSEKPWWGDTDRFRLARDLETLVAQEADAVMAITAQVRQELIERGIDGDKISLVPNAVDTNNFTPMPPHLPLREKLGVPASATVIGYAGSLLGYEGVADLVQATKLVTDAGREVRLVVVGDGKELPNLKLLARELGLEEQVIFTGRVPWKKVPDYISIFDIMPCPRQRLTVTELVSPLKPLEAMASAKAIILSDLAPSRDLAGANQERALLSEPGDPASLAAVIQRLVDSPELRLVMGRRARLWTVTHRTWTRAADEVHKAHATVFDLYRHQPTAPRAKDLTIGIIADQFTTATLHGEARFVLLRPGSWKEQLESVHLDALFVESAWEGTGLEWREKVGYYDDERFATLRALLSYCNRQGVPTIFWNKEDPVHFNRFRRTAKYFDHVFTTDADCIRRYAEEAGDRQRTIASAPFFAQPRLHNLLPAKRAYEHSVTYAGSFYGEKYKSRSAELAKLLTAAQRHGLAIYDRQHLNPESPYHFPDELQPFVRGGLDYGEMVEAYKAHPVHINVNSVDSSPTMFSRRAMEVVASGGAVISGKGKGVEHVFDSLVPVISNAADAGLLVDEWMNNETARSKDVWLAYRFVHRGHTAAHRLAYILRTAGLRVQAPTTPEYGVFLDQLTDTNAAMMAMQTIQPSAVYCSADLTTSASAVPVHLAPDPAAASRHALANGMAWLWLPGDSGRTDRTLVEDMMSALTYGQWDEVSINSEDLQLSGMGLSRYGTAGPGDHRLESLRPQSGRALTLRRALERGAERPGDKALVPQRSKRILVAGHDLKFASRIVSELESRGHTVSIDQWQGHNQHDEERSRDLLGNADVVFCEWTLGNAVWYSKNIRADQRLVTRLHLQEIQTAYLDRMAAHNIAKTIFVGQHIADIAQRDFNLAASRSVVIPNLVDVAELDRAKCEDARWNLGLVGIVPERKRIDKALDVLRALRQTDKRYQLFIKGKQPADYPWMADRPLEMEYYDGQYSRIEADPLLHGAVHFDGYGADMADWYTKIGIVLSVSDFESFHLTLADGAASGAAPVSLAWSGADQIYPDEWLVADLDAMTRRILCLGSDDNYRQSFVRSAKSYVNLKFAAGIVLPNLIDTILGE